MKRLVIFLWASMVLSFAAQAMPIVLVEDQTRLVAVPGAIGTVILGNPSIADVAVLYGSTLALTGKTYGRTNLVVRDERGDVLLDAKLDVTATVGPIVRVRRGTEGTSYLCGERCHVMTVQDLQPGAEIEGISKTGKEGPCITDDDIAADGSRCGKRSTASRSGGRSLGR